MRSERTFTFVLTRYCSHLQVLQTLKRFPELREFVVSGVLSRLLPRSIWQDRQLWKGFGKCCEAIVPHSFPLLLTVAPQPLEDLLTLVPEVRCECWLSRSMADVATADWWWRFALAMAVAQAAARICTRVARRRSSVDRTRYTSGD